jgi:hypothetical protein
MKALKHTFQNLGIDSWIFALTGLGAIVFSILSFFGKLPFTPEQTTAILVGAIGLLMTAVVTLGARRQTEISELKNALGIAEAQLLNSGREFGQHLASSVVKTKLFVLDSNMTSTIPRLASGQQSEYKRILSEKVYKQEIAFRLVGIVFHKQDLENKVFKLLLHEGLRYYIRHYEPPSMPIPIINLMSFDDLSFYLGGFDIKGISAEEQVLYIREQHLNQMLKEYWTVLWDNAIPLNDGGIINWPELKRISLRLNMSEKEFDEMVSKVKEDVQREKRQLRWR